MELQFYETSAPKQEEATDSDDESASLSEQRYTEPIVCE